MQEVKADLKKELEETRNLLQKAHKDKAESHGYELKLREQCESLVKQLAVDEERHRSQLEEV